MWDALTPENQARLLRAVVERVEVDEPANKINVALADIGVGAAANGVPQPVGEEAAA